MLKFSGSLVTRVLSECYYPTGGFMMANTKSNGSWVWKSLIWGHGLLEKGIRRRIGTGYSVSIYEDKWVPRPTSFKV